MNIKLLLICWTTIYCSSCYVVAGLRRTPKVYNALISTDENLTSSRAFPVIQPIIHETGIAQLSLGPFGDQNLYFPSLLPYATQQIPLHQQNIFPRKDVHEVTKHDISLPAQQADAKEQKFQLNNADEEKRINANDKNTNYRNQQSVLIEPSSIPLNEIGLPPSLISVDNQYAHAQQRPHSLLNNPMSVYAAENLPSYDFVYQPNHNVNLSPPLASEEQEIEPIATVDLNVIKNGSKNKNSDVPDVPPPPIPIQNTASRNNLK